MSINDDDMFDNYHLFSFLEQLQFDLQFLINTFQMISYNHHENQMHLQVHQDY
jgi:hypothetical protein